MGCTPSKNRTKPNPRFFGWFHIFANPELWLQISLWVVIISQYDPYVEDAVLDALSPPFSNLRSYHYSLSHFKKRLIVGVISEQLNE